MIEVIKTSLGFNVPVRFYADAAEADKDAGKVGALAEEGNNNLYYRAGCAQDAREIIAEVVEKATGIKRETQPVMRTVKKDGQPDSKEPAKDKEGSPVLEYVLDEDDYVRKALATANFTREQLQDQVTEACRKTDGGVGLRVDIRKTERKPKGPRTLPEKYAIGGRTLLETGKVAQFAKDYRKVVSKDLTEAQRTDVLAIGWALKELFDTKRQQDEAGYGIGK